MKSTEGMRVVTQPLLTLVLLGIITTATPGHLVSGNSINSRTFYSTQSYAIYPQWLASTDGRCEFSFKTSQENGILIYIDGNGELPLRFLYVELKGGQVAVTINVGAPESLTGVFGEHLNDNQLQTITIIHSNKEFDFRLNGTSVARLQYDHQFSFESRSRTFFGGLSPTHVPDLDLSQVNFIGCLQDIKFANGTSDAFSLAPQPPFSTRNVTVGCEDPCDSLEQNPCMNGGVCLTLWEGGGTALCDCRDSSPLKVGQHCNEDLSAHELLLSQDVYSCYTIPLNEPYTGEANTATFHLVTPIPSHGTIMTGVSTSTSAINGFFEIHLQDWRIFFDLQTRNASVVQLASQKTLSPSNRYQLDYQQRADYVKLTIWQINNGRKTLFDQSSENLQSAFTFDFNDICVGGGQLEVANYDGKLEYVFFRHYALAEQQNFDLLDQTYTKKSDVINFIEAADSPALSIATVGFGEWNLSFQVRTDPQDTGMLLSSSRNLANGSEFGLVKFENMLYAILAGAPMSFIECGEIVDSDWHKVDVDTLYSGNTFQGLVFSIDNIQTCTMTDSTFPPVFAPLLGAGFEFGKVTDSIGGESVPFIGCMRDITFERDSTTFMPNLEAAARVQERFDTTGCFYCSSDVPQAATPCQNGGSCQANRGYNDVECSCPTGYFGTKCEGNPAQPSPEPTSRSTTSTKTPTQTGVNDLRSLAIGTNAPSVLPTSTSTSPVPSSMAGTETPTPKAKEEREEDDSGPEPLQIGMWVAIGVGTIMLLVLMTIIVVMIYLIYRRTQSKERGFYRTHETREIEAAVPRYSASLQKASSQTVSTDTSNGNVATMTDQNRDREFYI